MTHSLAVSVKTVRDVLPERSRERSTRTGILYFAISAAMYWATFVLIAFAGALGARVLAAMLNGLAIGVLFIVGHDACHGSLTSNSRLNRWLGRLSFLPSLHPYSAWEYSHNALHHGWTNLKGKDPVYCPRTLDEFRRLSPGRQRLERFFRSWLGLLPLYLFEIWWPLELHPSRDHRAHIDKRGTFVFDRALVLAFPLVQVAVMLLATRQLAVTDGATSVTACAVAVTIPFLVFNWLIGFATFQHHTHPRVLWYADERDWNFFRAQVQGSVHIVFPRWIERALHNIMEHTAHHVDTRVPLYHLTDAQAAIESAFGEENVISEPFTLAGMRRTFRVCQLYDYTTHQWLTFEGRPTTEARLLADEIAVSNRVTGVSRPEVVVTR